jgi:alkylhydroperoxidase family enzyme
MPPRIELITEKSQIPESQHHEYDEIVGVLGRVGGPVGNHKYSPRRAQMVCKTGAHIRLQSSLTMGERETVILALCREKDAAYEWGAHVGTARNNGVSEEAIDVMRNGGDTSGLDADTRDIIEYTRQLLRNNKVDQKLFDDLIARKGTRWVVEITATAGQYSYISCMNNAFGMEPPEDGRDKLPVK